MALNRPNRANPWRGPKQAPHVAAPRAPVHGPNRINQWRQTYERYKALAEGSDDPVSRENYWQHAEHYIRLINEAGEGAR